MDALLKVNVSDVEAEDITWEASDEAEEVARVCDGEDPVEHEGPSVDVSA